MLAVRLNCQHVLFVTAIFRNRFLRLVVNDRLQIIKVTFDRIKGTLKFGTHFHKEQ
jgi:hypothetical protein